MDTIIIFGAKYLILLSGLIALWAFFRASAEKRREMIIFACVSLPLSFILAKIVNHFYFDPRPFVTGGFTPLIPHAADNGFPSDHTLLAAALAAVVAVSDRRLAAALWVMVVLIGAARVAAGVHHVVDIIGSIVVVLAAKWIARAIIHKLWNTNNRTNS